jgi:hypothetical protein
MWKDLREGSQVPKEPMPKDSQTEQANLRRSIEAAKPETRPTPPPPPKADAAPAPQKHKPEITKTMQKIDLYRRNGMVFHPDEVSLIVKDVIEALSGMTIMEFAVFAYRVRGGQK